MRSTPAWRRTCTNWSASVWGAIRGRLRSCKRAVPGRCVRSCGVERRSGSRRGLSLADEGADLGVRLPLEASPAEDAVVTDPGLQEVALAGVRDTGAQVLGRLGLPRGADGIVLALDSEQRRLDRSRLDLSLTPSHAATREVVILEDRPGRLQVKLGAHVEHREVLLVEITSLTRVVVVARREGAHQA